MKNFKIAIASLSVLFILSVLIISCQQETLTEDLTESTSDATIKAVAYTLPKGFEDKPSDEIISYLDDLSDSKLEKLAENYKIKTFLDQENLYETIYNQLEEGQLFADINLNKQLTSEQLQRLNNFSTDEVISSRDCYTTPAYPMYKCNDPEWCGRKDHKHAKCHPYTTCNSTTAMQTKWEQHCGYPQGVVVLWIVTTCYYGPNGCDQPYN